MVVERAPLIYAVGYAAPPQRRLQRLRLVVRAVEYRRLLPAVPRRAEAVAQRRGYGVGLLTVGVGVDDAYALALGPLRETSLLHTPRIVLDDRIGRVDDRLRRAVVLLQLEDLRVGVVVAEGEDILDLGAAERIDALGVVAHDADARVAQRQTPYDHILRIVGILILVNQNILEQILIARQHVGTVPQQDIGLQQQVVEVHSPVLLAAPAILGIYVPEVGYLRLPVLGRVGRVGDVGRGRHKAVLGVGYAREYAVGLVLVVRELHLLADRLDEVLGIRGLVDRIARREAYALGILAQDARKDRVERTHAYVAALAAYHLLDAAAHLLRRLVGEGQRQYVLRRDTLLQHVGYARGEHPRLARTRARDDERRCVVVDDGGALRLVQTLEYFGFHRMRL